MAGFAWIAGLVAITAGCAFVNNWGALTIGVLGGVAMYYGTLLLEALDRAAAPVLGGVQRPVGSA